MDIFNQQNIPERLSSLVASLFIIYYVLASCHCFCMYLFSAILF